MRPRIIAHAMTTDNELSALKAYPEHALFWKFVLEPLATDMFLPPDVYVMITSINTNIFTGKARLDYDPKVTHYKSHACDYTLVKRDGVTGNYVPYLPIPMNRNKLLGDTIKHLVIKSGHHISKFPMIALESDHIHTDNIRPGMIIYYNEVRPKFDRNSLIASLIYTKKGDYDVILENN